MWEWSRLGKRVCLTYHHLAEALLTMSLSPFCFAVRPLGLCRGKPTFLPFPQRREAFFLIWKEKRVFIINIMVANYRCYRRGTSKKYRCYVGLDHYFLHAVFFDLKIKHWRFCGNGNNIQKTQKFHFLRTSTDINRQRRTAGRRGQIGWTHTSV